MILNRRQFVFASAMSGVAVRRLVTVGSSLRIDDDLAYGLLIGSLLGDAMGGPLEFATNENRKGNVVGARQWAETRRLEESTIAEIASKTTLMSYEKVRPEPAAYGPWLPHAPAGTITDDSRWKIILIRAIRDAQDSGSKRLTQDDIARQICKFRPKANRAPDEATQKLIDEGLHEYRLAANWILGKRDPKVALPLDRLWAGIPNCSGQMMLLPLAIRHAGDPEAAYRESFELNFIDSAGAKDIASAIVAGLASVLGTAKDDSDQQRWQRLVNTMQSVDPFRFNEVPFAGRPLNKWLKLVDSIIERAKGRPAVAYRLLETEGKPVYFWDAHFTLVVALTLLKLSDYDAMCSLALAIDFGHDTDSYAQLIGAFSGAVLGKDAFPQEMCQILNKRLKEDYGEDVTQWSSLFSPSNTADKR